MPERMRTTVPLAAWWILIISSFDSVLSLIDRQAVAILKVELGKAFGFGDSGYGLVTAAFLIAYGVFNIPAGWLADRYGSRICLTAFIVVWSAATFATGLARTTEQLILLRFLLGAAEAGLVPATMVALIRWFPGDKLATVYSFRGPVTALGPTLAPIIIVSLTLAFGWRETFFVLGAVGILFGAIWWLSDTRGTAPAERPVTAFGAFRALFTNRFFLLLLSARLITDPLWFFIQFWQPGFFQEELGLELADLGRLLWIPPICSTVLTVGVSAFADWRIRQGVPATTSRLGVLMALAGLAPLVALIPFTSSVSVALLLFVLVQTMCWSWLAISSVVAATNAPAGTSATALATLNTPGIVVGALFNALAGTMIEADGYQIVFLIQACLHPIGAFVLFKAIRQSRVVEANA